MEFLGCFKGSVGEVILRDDDFGCSEQLGLLERMASGTDGVRIWDMACQEDCIGSERR